MISFKMELSDVCKATIDRVDLNISHHVYANAINANHHRNAHIILTYNTKFIKKVAILFEVKI